MAEGTPIETKGILIKYTMSKAAAEDIKTRFIDRGMNGESVSWLDCCLFDAALEVLGIEQAYYGYGDDEWNKMLEDRKENEKRFKQVKTIDVTDTWKELVD